MKLPEPDTHCWDDDTQKDVWSYSKELVEQMLAQADKDFSDGMTVVHLQGADQMRRKYDPVLKIALESLDHSCGDRCNAEYNPCHARLAADTIRKLLG